MTMQKPKIAISLEDLLTAEPTLLFLFQNNVFR